MFMAVLLTRVQRGKLPPNVLLDEWIKHFWYIYTAEYYSAAERNEV